MAYGRARIGISGWTYAGWRGRFYPKDLAHRAELAFAARRFDAIEINGTFYGLQRPESFARWREQTPDDFVFALKGPRFITHFLKATRPEIPLANFFASGPLALGPKLGPILWQFPPAFHFQPDRLDAFLTALPRDTAAALALARRHDQRLAGRAFLEIDDNRPLRHAVEIRHDSFRAPEFIAMLRRHGVGLVVADTVDWPLLMDVTSDFIYVRLHGSEELYASGYEPPSLDRWAALVAAWSAGSDPVDVARVCPPSAPRPQGRDVFVFFDNDAKVRAPADAAALAARLPGWRAD